MTQSSVRASAALLAILVALSGCVSPSVADICTLLPEERTAEGSSHPCQCLWRESTETFDFSPRRRLDLLLVIGNTRGMVSKQLAAIEAVQRYTALLESWSIDYRIAVVSTDVGTWTDRNAPWSMSAGACDSYEGDDGRFQARSCLDRGDLSAEAAAACRSVCPDHRYLPSDGRPFIAREQGRSNVPPILDPKTGRAIASGDSHALGCMMLLGDGGCGVSSPLESAKRALDGHLSGNSGFRRNGAVFTVFFVTDQDDCSMQLSRRSENDPRTQNCATPNRSAAATCYQLGTYRCLARDLDCDQPMNVSGVKTSCRERADTPLEPVEKYAQFFKALVPEYLLTSASIWPLPSLEEGGKLVVTQNPNVAGSAGLEPGRGIDASCQADHDPTWTGSGQVRLSKFWLYLLGKYQNGNGDFVPFRQHNSCKPSEYLDSLFDSQGGGYDYKLKSYCLPAVPQLWESGNPACLVGYVPYDTPQALPESFLPVCGPSCCRGFATMKDPMPTRNPQLALACEDELEDCYCVVQSEVGECSSSDQVGYVAGLYRPGNLDPPRGHQLSFRCSAQCLPPGSSAQRTR